jgi:hypothetical protein
MIPIVQVQLSREAKFPHPSYFKGRLRRRRLRRCDCLVGHSRLQFLSIFFFRRAIFPFDVLDEIHSPYLLFLVKIAVMIDQVIHQIPKQIVLIF